MVLAKARLDLELKENLSPQYRMLTYNENSARKNHTTGMQHNSIKNAQSLSREYNTIASLHTQSNLSISPFYLHHHDLLRIIGWLAWRGVCSFGYCVYGSGVVPLFTFPPSASHLGGLIFFQQGAGGSVWRWLEAGVRNFNSGR